MSAGRSDPAAAPAAGSPATGRIESFIGALLARDPAGGSWLSRLLDAAPHGRERFGELVDAPGWLLSTLAVPAARGRLGAFEYPAMPARELQRWFVDHPDRLRWPQEASLSPEVLRLRRALLCDEPPGARHRAQERARELMGVRSALAREWWRFEDVALLDCALITDRIVLVIREARGPELEPVTPWYPPRPGLVRDMEAAAQIAAERQRWGTLLLSDAPVPAAADAALADLLPAAAPHLSGARLEELRASFLGNLTWDRASAAVGGLA